MVPLLITVNLFTDYSECQRSVLLLKIITGCSTIQELMRFTLRAWPAWPAWLAWPAWHCYWLQWMFS